ncbi:hypothetical protein ACFPTO_21890 [Paraburkholderia denitrificans]|uniref:Uncharacterized protein n=1 Tax=Paraburkholderia denitrificans TaxID=694025 RepID=A0ABW0JEL3_9BURK
MNTPSQSSVPANSSASSRKAMTLLLFLALIGASGVAVSLIARHFL